MRRVFYLHAEHDEGHYQVTTYDMLDQEIETVFVPDIKKVRELITFFSSKEPTFKSNWTSLQRV